MQRVLKISFIAGIPVLPHVVHAVVRKVDKVKHKWHTL
jgi:hypothetical protein